MEPDREQAYEYYEDNKEQVFEDCIIAGKITDTELINIVMNSPKLFNLLCEEWCKDGKREEMLEAYYFASLPDGPEDREDR